MSLALKNALVKLSWDRTPKDLALIQNLIMRIKAFETYSMALKAELSRVLLYEKFGERRIVIQQGCTSAVLILAAICINFIIGPPASTGMPAKREMGATA